MPINRISKSNNQSFYFLTPTIKNWYYIFDRHNRFQILADCLMYCQKHKGLEIYAYVFMLNHLHLIIKSPDAIGFVRDFKSYTSKELMKNLSEYEPDVLALFLDEDGKYSFWKEDNQPRILECEKFMRQKLNYIHNNPVVKGYVERTEYWKWSSANLESEIRINGFG